MTEAGFTASETAIESVLETLRKTTYAGDELRLIADEFENAARMLLLCATIGRQKLLLAQGVGIDTEKVSTEHCRLWLARNRLGGLDDSLKRLSLIF